MLRPVGALFSSPVILNKIMFTVFNTGLWAVFAFAQVRYRDTLWSQRSLSIFASIPTVLGYGGVMFRKHRKTLRRRPRQKESEGS